MGTLLCRLGRHRRVATQPVDFVGMWAAAVYCTRCLAVGRDHRLERGDRAVRVDADLLALPGWSDAHVQHRQQLPAR